MEIGVVVLCKVLIIGITTPHFSSTGIPSARYPAAVFHLQGVVNRLIRSRAFGSARLCDPLYTGKDFWELVVQRRHSILTFTEPVNTPSLTPLVRPTHYISLQINFITKGGDTHEEIRPARDGYGQDRFHLLSDHNVLALLISNYPWLLAPARTVLVPATIHATSDPTS